MHAQIIAVLLIAAFCCEATYLPGTFGLGGANYAALGLGYPTSPYSAYAAPISTYAAAAYNPATAMKVIKVAPSNFGSYVIVSDVAGVAPAAGNAVVEPATSVINQRKVINVAPSDLGNYVIVSDVAGLAPAVAPAITPAVAPVASYAVVDPTTSVIKDAVSRHVAPLRSYGNIAYVVKK